METADLVREFKAHHADVKAALEKAGVKDSELDARLTEMEQKIARRGGGGESDTKSVGQQVVESEEYKSLASRQGGKTRISLKTVITTGSSSGGPLAPPDQVRLPNMLPRNRFRFRSLLSAGQTTSTSIEYPRQTTRTNAAAIQAVEGDTKPESALAFETVTIPVKTVAHVLPASRQVLDDAAMLQSIIDTEMRYGLEEVVEAQLLMGSGSGANFNGVYTQATAFSAPFAITSANMVDMILQAIAQVQAAGYEPDGIVVNATDWSRMLATKDSAGNYVFGDPQKVTTPSLFGLPVVPSPSMTIDKFLVGQFRLSTVFTRQEATVEISTEHSDYFAKNLVLIRAEERLALAVPRPGAAVKGDFGNVT